MDQDRPTAPGLKWRKRGNGTRAPYWLPSVQGYPIKSVPLQALVSQPQLLVQRCERLQEEMRDWIAGKSRGVPAFNGTFGSMIDNYLRDPESTYHTNLKDARVYTVYAAKLRKHIGKMLIDDVDGRDVQRWFRAWAGVADLRDPQARLPRAHAMLTVLKAANSFGKACRLGPCKEFASILEELSFPKRKPRTFAPTAAQIVALRKAAHAAGAGRRALAYAMQFETGLRQWDVIGQLLPMSDPRVATVLLGNRKWIGPMWEHIDANMILRVKPTKTEDTTEAVVTLDLAACPMVMEEIGLIPAPDRAGPLIIDETTGEPYDHAKFRYFWRPDFDAAGLPKKMWNRDLRAGSSTEASKSNVSKEDRAKLHGHSEEVQGQVYDRDMVEAHRRTMKARVAFRNGGGT